MFPRSRRVIVTRGAGDDDGALPMTAATDPAETDPAETASAGADQAGTDAAGTDWRRLPAPQPARGGWHAAEWAAELAGTAIVLFVGVSAVCLDFGVGSPMARAIPSTSWRLLLTGLIFAGSGSLVAVSPLGKRSGAHLNPAVTLAFWVNRHVHRHDLAGYVVAQVAGALLGAEVVRLVWGHVALSVSDGRTAPGRGLSPLGAATIEAAMTAALVMLIFSMLSSVATARWTPVAVWLLIASLVWQVAPYTGTSLNPARSLGPAVVVVKLAGYWIYVIGPLAGALAACGLWVFVPRQTLTAKLFHDSRVPSTMRTVLPARPVAPRRRDGQVPTRSVPTRSVPTMRRRSST